MEDRSRSPPPPTLTEAAPLTEQAVRAIIREEVAAAVAAALAPPSTSRPPSTPATAMSEEVMLNGEEEEEEEEDADLSGELCLCLFCSSEQASAAAILDHCKTEHDIDLLMLVATKLDHDFYSCVKLVNYIRRERPPPSFLLPFPPPPYPWDDDSYYLPVLEGDPLLQVDWEGAAEDAAGTERSTPPAGTSEDNKLSVVLKRLQESERKAGEYKAALGQALTDFQIMRLAMRQMIGDEEADPTVKTAATRTGSDSGEEEEEADGYFSVYSHFSIHLKMLSDRVRTEAYKNFISKNTALFKDKVVLDIGCGTGILSLFAAKAGAKHVIGVDRSSMIYNAMEIIRENGYEDKITLIRGKVEEVQLPVDKVDIILSEWMGCFLLFESMLDTVIFARDKWLQDPTHVYPNVCTMKVVAVSDKTGRETRIDFWDNVYGFKMSCVKSDILKEASVHCVDPNSTISSTHTLKEFDISGVTVGELDFKAPFQLTMQQNTLCYAIVGYFDAEFMGPQHTEFLKTGPLDTPTHWMQTVLYLQDPIPVHTGDVLEGSVAVTKSKQDPRALEITLTFSLSSPLTETAPLSGQQRYKLS